MRFYISENNQLAITVLVRLTRWTFVKEISAGITMLILKLRYHFYVIFKSCVFLRN